LTDDLTCYIFIVTDIAYDIAYDIKIIYHYRIKYNIQRKKGGAPGKLAANLEENRTRRAL